MTTTPDLAAAREKLTAAEAEVDRLRSQLRGALADQDSRGLSAADEDKPRRLGWADGLTEARRRYGAHTANGTAPDAADEDRIDESQRDTTAEAGRAEARRRAARRA